MGWWGHYVGGKAPTGKERIELVLRENGWKSRREEQDGRIWEVIDTAIRGTVVYVAIRVTENGSSRVFAEVNLTRFEKDGYLMVKQMSETMGPNESHCPKHILDKLSPTDSEWANAWRERCRQNLKGDEIGKLPLGTKIKVGKQAETVIVEVCKYRGRRAYIDWEHMIRYKPHHLRYYGYEIL